MDTNPYKPPDSPLSDSAGKPGRSAWWKGFFWLSAAFTLLSLPALATSKVLTPLDYADCVFTLIALVGLYGYSYSKRIGDVVFWRYFFYAALLETAVFTLVFPLVGVPRYGSTIINSWYIVEIAYALLVLLALYRYAYRAAFTGSRM